jgi:hypothetical protein
MRRACQHFRWSNKNPHAHREEFEKRAERRKVVPEAAITSKYKAVLFGTPALRLYTKEAATYVAGFLARVVPTCDLCRTLLADKSKGLRFEFDTECGVDLKYIRDLDRGGLTYPTSLAVACVKDCMAVMTYLKRCVIDYTTPRACAAPVLAFSFPLIELLRPFLCVTLRALPTCCGCFNNVHMNIFPKTCTVIFSLQRTALRPVPQGG